MINLEKIGYIILTIIIFRILSIGLIEINKTTISCKQVKGLPHRHVGPCNYGDW